MIYENFLNKNINKFLWNIFKKIMNVLQYEKSQYKDIINQNDEKIDFLILWRKKLMK